MKSSVHVINLCAPYAIVEQVVKHTIPWSFYELQNFDGVLKIRNCMNAIIPFQSVMSSAASLIQYCRPKYTNARMHSVLTKYGSLVNAKPLSTTACLSTIALVLLTLIPSSREKDNDSPMFTLNVYEYLSCNKTPLLLWVREFNCNIRVYKLLQA